MTRIFLVVALIALAIILGPSLHRELLGTPAGEAYLVGLASGAALVAGFAVVWLIAADRHRRALPPATPATPRAIARARRHNQPQLWIERRVRDRRNWLPPSDDQFDSEPTQDHCTPPKEHQ